MQKGVVALLCLLLRLHCLHIVARADTTNSHRKHLLKMEQHEPELNKHHHLSRQGVACHGGFPDISRKHWWRFFNFKHPGLADAFATGAYLVAVLNLVDDMCSQCGGGSWWQSEWSATYSVEQGTRYQGTLMGRDPNDNTMLVQFPLPSGLQGGTAQLVSILGQHGEEKALYTDVPFCDLPEDNFFLVACTEVNNDFKYLAPEWIEYHLKQGYERITLYANEDPSDLQSLLRPYTELGVVEIVDWHFPQPDSGQPHLQQESQENSCMQRYRSRTRWLASHDVDEFAQPMQAGQTVASWLRSMASLEHIGSFTILTQFFGSSRDEIEQQSLDERHDLVLSRYTHRNVSPSVFHRQKYIARPQHVQYTATHTTVGGIIVVPNSMTEIRFAHFKLPSETRREVRDESLARASDVMGIRATLASRGYEPFVPVQWIVGFRLACSAGSQHRCNNSTTGL